MNRKKVNPFAHKTRRYRGVYDLDHILHELVFLDTKPYSPRKISIPTDYDGLEEVFFV